MLIVTLSAKIDIHLASGVPSILSPLGRHIGCHGIFGVNLALGYGRLISHGKAAACELAEGTHGRRRTLFCFIGRKSGATYVILGSF